MHLMELRRSFVHAKFAAATLGPVRDTDLLDVSLLVCTCCRPLRSEGQVSGILSTCRRDESRTSVEAITRNFSRDSLIVPSSPSSPTIDTREGPGSQQPIQLRPADEQVPRRVEGLDSLISNSTFDGENPPILPAASCTMSADT